MGRNRQHVCEDPLQEAKELFKILAEGGEKMPYLGKGTLIKLPDKTTVLIRKATKTPNSPAVNIGDSASSLIKNQKIHFVRR